MSSLALLVIGSKRPFPAPPSVADAFIAQCAQAVKSVRQGRFGYSFSLDGHSQTMQILVKGDASLLHWTRDGKPFYDVLSTPTQYVAVHHGLRQYSAETFAAEPMKKVDPPAPLAPGTFNFTMDQEDGFVLQSNPDFKDAKVRVSGASETLTATVPTSDGNLKLTLIRDRKTRRPQSLSLGVDGVGSELFRILCEAAPIDDAALVIPPSRYAGYGKVKSVPAPSGNF